MWAILERLTRRDFDGERNWRCPASTNRARLPGTVAAARERREDRAVEKLAGENPLFADQIRTEGTAGLKRGHGIKRLAGAKP
jgi:hypothetical protein